MPVRVLWLIRGLGPGGAEHLLLHQAAVMDRSGFLASCAYSVPTANHLVGSLEAEGIPVHLLDSRPLRRLVRLRRLVKAADVVHSHSPAMAILARLVCLTVRPQPALVSTEHNVWGAYRWPTRWGNAATAWMDDARVAVSRDARESMLRWLRPKTEVVDHGIAIDALPDRADSRRRIRDELALGEEVILVVTVANYRVHKDYPNLLNAFRRLVDRAEVPVHLAVVGRGPLEAEIRELVDTLDLAAAVTLLGYRADATAVIAAADIFTLASRQEGRPVALMEALALGCPVVVTAAGGIPEMVEDGREGRIVRVEHSGELADALLALVASSGERARFAVAAAVRGQGFDITLAQRALEQIYSRVVKSRQAS